jgi:hypothetical protein
LTLFVALLCDDSTLMTTVGSETVSPASADMAESSVDAVGRRRSSARSRSDGDETRANGGLAQDPRRASSVAVADNDSNAEAEAEETAAHKFLFLATFVCFFCLLPLTVLKYVRAHSATQTLLPTSGLLLLPLQTRRIIAYGPFPSLAILHVAASFKRELAPPWKTSPAGRKRR